MLQPSQFEEALKRDRNALFDPSPAPNNLFNNPIQDQGGPPKRSRRDELWEAKRRQKAQEEPPIMNQGFNPADNPMYSGQSPIPQTFGMNQNIGQALPNPTVNINPLYNPMPREISQPVQQPQYQDIPKYAPSSMPQDMHQFAPQSIPENVPQYGSPPIPRDDPQYVPSPQPQRKFNPQAEKRRQYLEEVKFYL